MPNCKLIWGSSSSHSLTLEVGRRGLVTSYKQERYQNKSTSGKIEQINLHGIQEMEIDFYITEDKYRDAVAWWSWSRQGKTFAFANSASTTGATTLASAASASDSTLVVASASSFSSSDEILVRSIATDDVFELVKISAISSVTLTITTGLKYDYAAGATVRHKDYWGSCIMLDTTFNPQQSDAGFYNHRIKFTEAL